MKGNYRYTVLGLLFLATTINYIDRQIIGLLKPTLEKEFQWTEQDYANIVFWFQVMYAVGYLMAGRFVDKAGAKIGYSIAVLLWSLSAMAHALAKSTLGFNIARGALGFSEGGNFPAAIKTIAEWFPVKERSFASGFMISGTTVGPILAPGIVLWLANSYSWQISFIITGALGLVWLIAWYFLYEKPEKHKRISKEELAYINDGSAIIIENNKVPWSTLLNKKATWGYFVATFLTDPVWWFYLFWLPSFLTNNGMAKNEIAFPLTVVYAVTAVLSIAGGWLSSYFIKKGWTVNSSRKTTMLICVCMALPVMLIRFSDDIWISVMIIAVAAAAQTIWKGVLLTTVADQFPKKAVSSVSGIGGLGGAVGGMLAAQAVGILLDAYKANNNIQAGYNFIFILCGLAYIVAIAIFHGLSPQLKKVDIG
jgi:ACS family hexuronate transporter-like MFS transporter